MAKGLDIKKIINEITETNSSKHRVISSGIKSFDFILGGGIELGSKIQIVAESSTGKTTLSLQISKNLCSNGYNVLYVDTENSITRELLETTGCNTFYNENFVLLKESDFDTVNGYLDKCFKSRYFSLVIIDSLASLVNNCYVDPTNESDMKTLTNNNTNYESRPLNLFINKYSNLANRYDVAILYINQFRNKVDPKNGTILKEFGNKIVKYNSDIIIKIRKDKMKILQDSNGLYTVEGEKSTISIPTHAKLSFVLDKSNKLLSNTSVDTYIKYGYGIDETLDDLVHDIASGKIIKEGKYYHYQDSNEKYEGFFSIVNSTIVNNIKEMQDENTF